MRLVDSMVGKMVTRTAAATNTDGFSDSSYVGRQLEVVSVSNERICVKFMPNHNGGECHILPESFSDYNWMHWEEDNAIKLSDLEKAVKPINDLIAKLKSKGCDF